MIALLWSMAQGNAQRPHRCITRVRKYPANECVVKYGIMIIPAWFTFACWELDKSCQVFRNRIVDIRYLVFELPRNGAISNIQYPISSIPQPICQAPKRLF